MRYHFSSVTFAWRLFKIIKREGLPKYISLMSLLPSKLEGWSDIIGVPTKPHHYLGSGFFPTCMRRSASSKFQKLLKIKAFRLWILVSSMIPTNVIVFSSHRKMKNAIVFDSLGNDRFSSMFWLFQVSV